MMENKKSIITPIIISKLIEGHESFNIKYI